MARRLLFSIPALFVLLASPAAGLELDWDTHPWPGSGTLSQTYGIGGHDVTVTLFDGNGVFNTGGGGGAPASPTTSSFLNQTGEDDLFLRTDGNGSAPWVGIQVDFAHPGGVFDVAFSILDLDSTPPGSFVDQIRLRGLDGMGGNFAPTSVTSPTGTPSWSWNGARIVTGTGSSDHTSASWQDGTAEFHFADTITTLQIQYRNNFAGSPGNQWVSLSDLTFTPVPEPGTLELVMLGLLALAVARRDG